MKHGRRQIIDLGGLRTTKIGAPSPLVDIYYTMMALSWIAFVAAVSLIFIIINIIFGAAYACLPGAIGGMTSGSIVNGFFFSAETLATVGYGNMFPASVAGHIVATIEILLGLFFSATVTGLVFARFARPSNGFSFSTRAVIGEVEGKRTLMVRLASIRANPLADVTAQISWLERIDLADGRVLRRLTELPLIRPHNPMLGLVWTLGHHIELDSAMLTAFKDAHDFLLTVTVQGYDTFLATRAVGGRSYARTDILMDYEFVDAVEEIGHEIQFDFGKLSAVRPIIVKKTG